MSKAEDLAQQTFAKGQREARRTIEAATSPLIERAKAAAARLDRLESKAARGPQGEPGPPGPVGPIPAHAWQGTTLFFEKPDGTFDHGVDLQGPKGDRGKDGRGGGGGGIDFNNLPLAGDGPIEQLLIRQFGQWVRADFAHYQSLAAGNTSLYADGYSTDYA